MKLTYRLLLLPLGGLLLFLGSCNKNKQYDLITPPSQAHFTGARFQSYTMTTSPAPVYKLGVGTTDVSNADRTVSFKVTSSTGAVAGTHYSLPGGNTVTIPAGQTTASIDVQGTYAQYTTGRRDTLMFTLIEPALAPAKFSDTVLLVLRGPCFEGLVNLSAFTPGIWRAIETFGTGAPYGPYNTTIITPVQLTPTTATITVTNIWDNGWGPITFTLDWTDPVNRTVTVVPQAAIAGSNGGDFNAAYAGQTVQVRAFAGQPGTFSACNNTFTLKMQLGITGVGFFAQLYTVNLTR